MPLSSNKAGKTDLSFVTIFNDSIPNRCLKASNSFKCLQQADSATLVAVNNNITLNSFSGTFLFSPVVDGKFIVESPAKTLKKGRVNGVWPSYYRKKSF